MPEVMLVAVNYDDNILREDFTSFWQTLKKALHDTFQHWQRAAQLERNRRKILIKFLDVNIF